MEDSACLMHGYSKAAVLPNEFKQGNPMHALGDSISFGRFMTESMSWEKWSTFSHKKYVEEAESYSQPGSVAQKKAFFEAHYKRIAAQKAAALLEQENAANNAIGTQVDGGDKDDSADHSQTVSLKLNSHLAVDEKMEAVKNPDAIDDGLVNANKQSSISMAEIVKDQENAEITGNEYSGETPLKKSSFKKKFFPKYLRNLFNFNPMKKPYNEPNYATEKTESLGSAPSSFMTPEDCTTPLKTPVAEAMKGVSKNPAATPRSENRRKKTPTDPSPPGSRTTRRKGNIFSAISKSLTNYRNKLQSPSLSNPFILRTEERAAKRKHKVEEKFKANAVQKMQLQKNLKTLAAESQ